MNKMIESAIIKTKIYLEIEIVENNRKKSITDIDKKNNKRNM
jgi:hypothetical protein